MRALELETVECLVRRIALDYGDDFGFTEASPVLLCCPPDSTKASDLAACSVLSGSLVADHHHVEGGFNDYDINELVNITIDSHPGLARDVAGVNRGGREAFGFHQALIPLSVDRQTQGGGGRRLQTSTGGAKPDLRSSTLAWHGTRKVLAVIVGTEHWTDGTTKTWTNGAESCTTTSIRNLMFGGGGSTGLTVGGTPWANTTFCRTNNCHYNVEDVLSSLSRGAVKIYGDVVYLPVVSNWPSDCSFGNIHNAIKASLKANLNIDYDASDYVNLVSFVPNFCGYLGAAWLSSHFSVNRMCPGSGVSDSLLNVAAHEVGHNLGLHHAGNPTNEYADYSGVMVSALDSFARRPMRAKVASRSNSRSHRHDALAHLAFLTGCAAHRATLPPTQLLVQWATGPSTSGCLASPTPST